METEDDSNPGERNSKAQEVGGFLYVYMVPFMELHLLRILTMENV